MLCVLVSAVNHKLMPSACLYPHHKYLEPYFRRKIPRRESLGFPRTRTTRDLAGTLCPWRMIISIHCIPHGNSTQELFANYSSHDGCKATSDGWKQKGSRARRETTRSRLFNLVTSDISRGFQNKVKFCYMKVYSGVRERPAQNPIWTWLLRRYYMFSRESTPFYPAMSQSLTAILSQCIRGHRHVNGRKALIFPRVYIWKNIILLGCLSYSLVNVYWCFSEIYYFSLQGQRVSPSKPEVCSISLIELIGNTRGTNQFWLKK